jgi:hypothetical protein
MITATNPIWCELLDGFKIDGNCVKLNRALYGIRDSPLLWYDEFSRSLREAGLETSKEELCLYFTDDRKIMVLFYVDDCLLLFHRDHEERAKKI